MTRLDGYVEFEFDLPEALLSHLVSVFDALPGASLIPENVEVLPEAQGVYQLLLGGQVVYIGKTDAEAGLRNRLDRHAKSIQHRLNLDPTEVTFRAVRVFVFTAVDLETQLIKHYGSAVWNFSGFGSNDPGRNRDSTRLKPQGFDATYPIDIDRMLHIDWPESLTAAQIVKTLKSALPYTFRYELRPGGRKIHPDFEAATVTISPGPHSVRELVDAVIRSLPSGWQATALPSRVIIYRESVDYQYGDLIAKS